MKAIGDKEWNYGSNRKDSWVGAPVAKVTCPIFSDHA
jgi:hypothetical protein